MNNINDPTNMTLLRIKETAEIVNAVMLNGDLSKKIQCYVRKVLLLLMLLLLVVNRSTCCSKT